MRSVEKSVSHWLFIATRLSFFLLFNMTDIVAVAAGFVDGLGWGSNTKGSSHPSSTASVAVSEVLSPLAAIMRIGMEEVKDFCLEYFPSTQERTFLEESCGIADIITSCEFKRLTSSFSVPLQPRSCHPSTPQLSLSL